MGYGLFFFSFAVKVRVIMITNINGGLLKMGQLTYILIAAVVTIAVIILTGRLKKQVDENLNMIDEMEHKYKNKTLK